MYLQSTHKFLQHLPLLLCVCVCQKWAYNLRLLARERKRNNDWMIDCIVFVDFARPCLGEAKRRPSMTGNGITAAGTLAKESRFHRSLFFLQLLRCKVRFGDNISCRILRGSRRLGVDCSNGSLFIWTSGGRTWYKWWVCLKVGFAWFGVAFCCKGVFVYKW